MDTVVDRIKEASHIQIQRRINFHLDLCNFPFPRAQLAAMASLLKRDTFAVLRSHHPLAAEVLQFQSRRQLHVEAGAREKALLAKDPALERFKSYRKGASSIRRIGDYLTIAVVAGCCYEIYVRAVTREEARKAASGNA
ncbi:hypothetical protein LXL04_009582 [Taraxacum kok-saghyz]